MRVQGIIFDLDGTLYPLSDVLQMAYDMQVSFLASMLHISKSAAVKYLEEHHIYPTIRKDSHSATELFHELGLDKSAWSTWRERRFDVTKIHRETATTSEILYRFREFGPLILLSSNSYTIIQKILQHIQVVPAVFDKIICSDRYPCKGSFHKKQAMVAVLELFGIDGPSLLSIGDRYETDIAPILELGGMGIHLHSVSGLPLLYQALRLQDLKTCAEYTYYENQ